MTEARLALFRGKRDRGGPPHAFPRGHRRNFMPKREKSADPHAQSSRPSTPVEFSHVLENLCTASCSGSRSSLDNVTGPIKMWMSAHALAIVQSLILISAANGAPVFVARLLGARFARPIDGGIVLRDGHPLLGRSKTWRGLAAAILLAACAAVLMSLPWHLGALAAASAMAGDCLSSLVKRRFGLEPSSMTLGLDQFPESLFPAIVCSAYLPLSRIDVLALVLAFSVGELAMSRLFFAVGLRDRPY